MAQYIFRNKVNQWKDIAVDFVHCPYFPEFDERIKLSEQIIYRRKGNLLESPNHFKYRKIFQFRDFTKAF